MKHLNHTSKLAIFAAASALLTAFVACSSDNKNSTPTIPGTGGSTNTGGSSATGGGTSGGSSGTGGTSGNTGGSTSDASTGGSSTGGTAGDAGTGGTGTGGSTANCNSTNSSGYACWNCTPTNDNQFLNHCSSATCVGYDNSQLTRLQDGGTLPPLP